MPGVFEVSCGAWMRETIDDILLLTPVDGVQQPRRMGRPSPIPAAPVAALCGVAAMGPKANLRYSERG